MSQDADGRQAGADAGRHDGLDQRFLAYIDATETNERIVHEPYLKFFRAGQVVVDLGCGTGYFVKMLREQAVEARGVDRDAVAIEQASGLGAPVIQADALDYVREMPSESLDAIFSSHLVEHLAVPMVVQLVEQGYRALKPGGMLLVTTPNVRALVAHLELFWMHFGHERFYHPKLLAFFMEEAGFKGVVWGENESTGRLWNAGHQGGASSRPPSLLCPPDDVVFRPARHSLLRPWRRLKLWVGRMFVRPYVEALAGETGIVVSHLDRYLREDIVERVDRPFEVFVMGFK